MLKYNQFLESIKPTDFWDILPDSVKELQSMFKKAGKKLFVVGGSVRDYLNSDQPKDFDLATDALPDEVVSIIGKKWRINLQGKSFFVVVVYTEDQPKGMEIATFREDSYGEMLGQTRNPDVRFSTIEKDVERRDLTFNALFYDLDERKIIDLVGGVEDLENGVTRFVGDPTMRIKEDPLRILRLFRFTARYAFVIDPTTGEAISRNKEQLSIIVPERIWEEFYKAYNQVVDFTVYLNYIDEYKLWEQIFPGIKVESNVTYCSHLEVYLANLFYNNDLSRLESNLVQKCKIPIDIARVVAFLIWFKSFKVDDVFKFYTKKKSYNISDELIADWIRVANLSDMHKTFLKYRPTISSEDLMSKGFTGKALGDEKNRLEVINFKKML